MRTTLLFLLTSLGISTVAGAESFICLGTGRFAGVTRGQIGLEWPNASYSVVQDDAVRVQISLDKANRDGTHYLSIEVFDRAPSGALVIHSAKGSLRDMVQYAEGAESIITCQPILSAPHARWVD